MAATGFERTVWLFAGIIVPELENNAVLHRPFSDNFDKLMHGIEADSFQKIKLLVKVVGVLSWAYNQNSFHKLTLEQRKRFIGLLYRFPISKIVSGLTGLKSLVFIAYYGIDTVWENINYDGPIVVKDN